MADSGCRTEFRNDAARKVSVAFGKLRNVRIIIAVAPPTAGSQSNPIRMRHPAAAYYGSPSRTISQSAGAYGNSFV